MLYKIGNVGVYQGAPWLYQTITHRNKSGSASTWIRCILMETLHFLFLRGFDIFGKLAKVANLYKDISEKYRTSSKSYETVPHISTYDAVAVSDFMPHVCTFSCCVSVDGNDGFSCVFEEAIFGAVFKAKSLKRNDPLNIRSYHVFSRTPTSQWHW